MDIWLRKFVQQTFVSYSAYLQSVWDNNNFTSFLRILLDNYNLWAAGVSVMMCYIFAERLSERQLINLSQRRYVCMSSMWECVVRSRRTFCPRGWQNSGTNNENDEESRRLTTPAKGFPISDLAIEVTMAVDVIHRVVYYAVHLSVKKLTIGSKNSSNSSSNLCRFAIFPSSKHAVVRKNYTLSRKK